MVAPAHIPNYIDPPTRAPLIIVVNIVMVSIALFFVLLRIYTRNKITTLGMDDVLICFAWSFSLGMSTCIMMSTKYGLGRHLWDQRPEWQPMNLRYAYCLRALYNPTIMMTKTSILTFYINKLGVQQRFRNICWTMMGYIICSSMSIFFSIIFQCSPVPAAWDRNIRDRKCINGAPLYYFSGLNNIITDLILLVLPMRVIWKLKLPLRQRLGLVVVFAMGALVTGVSIIRLRMLILAISKQDFWASALSSMWSAVELNVAIICACMPAFKQFLSWIAPGIMGTAVKQTNSYETGDTSKYRGTVGNSGGSRGNKHSHGHGISATTVACTHHEGGSEEYIMSDLEGGRPGVPRMGINKKMEVMVESEEVKDDISQTTMER